MTAPHDPPEAVEAMAAWHGEGKAWPSDVPMPQLHSGPASCPASAAMLRRLHQRAVDAERERDENHRAWRDSVSQSDDLRLQRDEARQRIHDLEVVVENWRGLLTDTRASLATVRADAIREALEAVKGIETADIYSTGERHAAEEIRDFAVFLIGNLIEQPTTTTGEA